ncbi:MAG: LolA-like putative outer membrane lipoprotein chaperone [Bacteroidaceae bacterium]|nr:LolA-like putative outer membrane lipoprotein chaperone [Bacteroidaceae bacterium]
MKRIIIYSLLLISSLPLFADDAMKVLDIAADRIRKAGDIEIEYNASIFSGATEKASATGTMWLRENQMKLDAEGITTWYDGKTRWCYVPTSNEVNIDEPSKKEMAAMNPYTFMGIYKKGFKMTVKETVLRGEAVYEVYLKARYAKMDVKEIYVDIRKSDYQPLCIRVRESNDWQRVSITNFKSNLKFENEFFTFPTNDYPNVLINDMR